MSKCLVNYSESNQGNSFKMSETLLVEGIAKINFRKLAPNKKKQQKGLEKKTMEKTMNSEKLQCRTMEK